MMPYFVFFCIFLECPQAVWPCGAGRASCTGVCVCVSTGSGERGSVVFSNPIIFLTVVNTLRLRVRWYAHTDRLPF